MLILIFTIILLCSSVFYQIQLIPTELIDYTLVGATFVFFVLYLSKKVPKHIFGVLVGAFIVRFIVLLIDYYHIAPLLHSGADSEAFDSVTKFNIAKGHIFKSLTNYTSFLYYIYSISSGRFVAQFVNLVFGFSTIFVLYKSLVLCQVSSKVIFKIILIICFLPNHIILSVILLREAWIFYFIALSLYMVLKWYFVSPSIKYVLGAFLSVMLASYMHAGVVFMLVGYFLLFVFYNPIQKRIIIGLKSILFMAVGLVLLSVLFLFGDSFMGKFASIESDDLENMQELAKTYTTGESAYLTWVKPESILHLIVFTPLKFLYFIGSPMPFDWRGVQDVVAFILDGLLYIYLLISCIVRYRKAMYKHLLRAFTIGLTISFVAFSWGTWTAGTAMRHRCKLLVVFLVIYALQSIRSNNGTRQIYKNNKS